MAQILPQFDLAQELGRGLGTGIQTGLGSLLENKINQMTKQQDFNLKNQLAQQQQQQTYNSLLQYGLDPAKAQAIAGLSDKLASPLIKDLIDQQGMARFQEALGGQVPPQEGMATQSTQKPSIEQRREAARFLSPGQRDRLERQLEHEEKLDLQKRKLQNAEESELWKYSKDYIDTTEKEASTADQFLNIINQQKELDKTGKVNGPLLTKLLESVGLEALLTPESQFFKKAESSFVRGAKDVYGGRVTNYELQAFMRQFPTLRNTAEGRMIIYRALENQFKGAKIKNDIKNEIIEENGGKPPRNIRALVDKRSKEALDDLANDTLSLIKEGAAPKGQKGQTFTYNNKQYRYLGNGKAEEI